MDLSDDFIDGVYEAGEDDWVQFIDLGHLLIEETGTNDDLIERGVAAAAELIDRDVLQPGQLTDAGFEPWTCDKQGAVAHIRASARDIARQRNIFWPGDICWFQTPNFSG